MHKTGFAGIYSWKEHAKAQKNLLSEEKNSHFWTRKD